jgi:hypothetical protein
VRGEEKEMIISEISVLYDITKFYQYDEILSNVVCRIRQCVACSFWLRCGSAFKRSSGCQKLAQQVMHRLHLIIFKKNYYIAKFIFVV